MDDFAELDDFLADYGGPWAAYIVRALWLSPLGLSRAEVLRLVEIDANARGRAIPPTFEETIQATFHAHNRGSLVFEGAMSSDIFCFVRPKGDGHWGLNRRRARDWMVANDRGSDLD